MSTTETEVRRPPPRKQKPTNDAEPADLGNAAPTSAMPNALGTALPRPQLVDARSRIIWPYIIGITLFHLLIPLAFLSYVFSWWGVVWLPIGNYIFCSMGIGAGYHRLLTHRGYKCPSWLEHTLAVLGMCNLQDSPARWVVVHRIHHQHSDHQPDPHTPQVGWFWSHVGWLFVENRETTTAEAYHKYAGDVLSDPFYMKLERYGRYFWVYAIQFPVFYALGVAAGYLMHGTLAAGVQCGVQWLLWGVVYRTLYTWHVTWGVNSAAHLWGYRNYDTRENSRNNWLIALGTNGEGWHNNHHADPRSAAHGHRWWEFDVTYMTICLWERLGLAWDIERPNQSLLNRRKKVARNIPR
jgi:stearoyl-CoA desaturase (delta-9 desaturase)